MKITKHNASILQIEAFNKNIVFFAIIMLVFSLWRMIYLIANSESDFQQFISPIVCGLLSFFAGNAFSEKTTFQFIKEQRLIKWHRKKIIGKAQEGEIPFDAIEDIKLGITDLGHRAKKYRIEIQTSNSLLPISNVYSIAKKEEYSEIIKQINEYIHGS